jgi:hypothetical protein
VSGMDDYHCTEASHVDDSIDIPPFIPAKSSLRSTSRH